MLSPVETPATSILSDRRSIVLTAPRLERSPGKVSFVFLFTGLLACTFRFAAVLSRSFLWYVQVILVPARVEPGTVSPGSEKAAGGS